MILHRRQLLASTLVFAIPGRAIAATLAPTASELGAAGMVAIADDIWVKQIGVRNWLFSATMAIDGGVIYPSNGLIHQGEKELVLIDPGWSGGQAEALVSFCRKQFGRAPSGAIATHFHDDRIGGAEALQRLGVAVHMSDMTARLAMGLEVQPVPPGLTETAFGLETFYPGPAHAPDNIVVWEAGERLLFGGCMIKSVTSTALGNLGDADLEAWPQSLDGLARRYPTARLVIPGHGRIEGDTIGRTRDLLKAAREAKDDRGAAPARDRAL